MVDVVTETAKLAERVELAIGGRTFDVWSSVSITRSLDTLAGTFEFNLANRLRDSSAPLDIHAGDACQVRIAGETVIEGYVDSIGPTRASEEAGISIRGRDKTGDLADCAAVHKPGSWANASIEAIANDLTRPFGISVTAKVSTGARIPRFALQPSETVQAAIERLLRFRGLLMQPTASGNVEIITPDEGAPAATLEVGVNVLSVSATHDMSGRYSDYIVKGQAAGTDQKHGKTVSQIRGEAKDSEVGRYRPLLIVAEDQADGASAATRAAFEAGVRKGKSVSAEVDVLGWRATPGGRLWLPNLGVRLKAPAEQLPDAQMIVSAVTLRKDDGGTIASLTLMPPGAWAQLAEGGKAKGQGK